jgi:hypothetical protein
MIVPASVTFYFIRVNGKWPLGPGTAQLPGAVPWNAAMRVESVSRFNHQCVDLINLHARVAQPTDLGNAATRTLPLALDSVN